LNKEVFERRNQKREKKEGRLAGYLLLHILSLNHWKRGSTPLSQDNQKEKNVSIRGGNKIMKTKLVGICICMLLIATAVPAVTSIKNSAILTTVPGAPQTCTMENWTETQKLLASDGAVGDVFGFPVHIDEDTALIGAPYDDDHGANSGSVYVFTRTGTTWTEQAKLVPSDGATEDYFGYTVSLDGDTALIGAYLDDDNGNASGSAYIFTRTDTTWTQQAKLHASDGVPGDWFSYCGVSVDGDTALIGAAGHNNIRGAAYVFTRTGTTWTQQAELNASDAVSGDAFGICVSLFEDTALIGANGDDGQRGSAYVFTRTGTTWTEQAKFFASDGFSGDLFGWPLSLDGDTALIGARFDDDHGTDSGSAYVFTRNGTTWAQQAKLTASDGATNDGFGWATSLYGDTILIGAPGDNNYKGSAYLFTRTGTNWTQQQKLVASDGAGGDCFANDGSIYGNTAIIGSPNDNGKGSAYVFTNAPENQPPVADFTWTPQNPSINQQITFDASASQDPDGTITLYEWDWNNDDVYEESHTTPTATHSWANGGNYSMALRVTDDDDATATITKTINVNATAPSLTIEDFKGGIGISATVKNVGNATGTSIIWSIDLVGKMIFKGNHWTGSIESLAPGDTMKIKTGLILGFGKIYINATATCAEGATYSEEGTGILFLFLTLGIKEPLP
jgi:hypothetical protein